MMLLRQKNSNVRSPSLPSTFVKGLPLFPYKYCSFPTSTAGIFRGRDAQAGAASGFAQRKVELLANARIVRLEVADVIAAIELHRLYKISFWDALIVHAARSAGAVVLYTEDLHAGAVLGGVRVVNPFALPAPGQSR